MPFATCVPWSTQVSAPVLQLVSPWWQAFVGVQAAFATQAMQVPEPSQT